MTEDGLKRDSSRGSADGHSNGHDRDRDYSAAGRRALLVAFGINTGFVVVELVGALLADSLTLLADAAHMVTDSASLLLALFAAWVATRQPDARRTYGYHRAEVLGALANGLFLLAVVGYVLYDAFRRFGDPQPVDAPLVIGVGVAGLAANLAAARVLSDHRGSLNVEGAFIHLVADAAGSVAAIVLGAALLITDWYLLDPLFAVLIAVLVLYSVWGLLEDSLNILLQGTPKGLDIDEVTTSLRDLPGVADVHHLHVWALDSQRTALSAHLVIDVEGDAESDSTTVLRRAQQLLGERFDINHATLQLEGDHVETADFECYPAQGGASGDD